MGKGVNGSPSHTPPGRGHNPASDSGKKKDAIEFFWQGVPPRSTAQTRRHTRAGKTYRTPANRRAVATLRAVCEPHAPRIAFAGPVSLEAALTFPSRSQRVLPRTSRPDADNLAKDLLDALQATGFFRDDAQVVCLTVRKFNGPIPGIFVKVQTMQEQIMQTDTPPHRNAAIPPRIAQEDLTGSKAGRWSGRTADAPKMILGARRGNPKIT